jgi:hypothetical protein
MLVGWLKAATGPFLLGLGSFDVLVQFSSSSMKLDSDFEVQLAAARLITAPINFPVSKRSLPQVSPRS